MTVLSRRRNILDYANIVFGFSFCFSWKCKIDFLDLYCFPKGFEKLSFSEQKLSLQTILPCKTTLSSFSSPFLQGCEYQMSMAQVCGKESSLWSVWEFTRILLAAIGRSAIFVWFVECILLVFLTDFLFWLLHVSQLKRATLMTVWCTGSEFNKLKILIFQICTSLKYSSEKYCFNWPYWGHLFSSFLCFSFFCLYSMWPVLCKFLEILESRLTAFQ